MLSMARAGWIWNDRTAMNKDYLDSIDRAMARERAFMLAMQETALAGRLFGVRQQLGQLVRNVAHTDDLPQMIAEVYCQP